MDCTTLVSADTMHRNASAGSRRYRLEARPHLVEIHQPGWTSISALVEDAQPKLRAAVCFPALAARKLGICGRQRGDETGSHASSRPGAGQQSILSWKFCLERNDRAKDVLTPDQQEKYAELLGEPFDMTRVPLPSLSTGRPRSAD